MKLYVSIFLIGLCTSTLALATPIVEPPNLGLHKIELERYHDNGKYNADIDSVITGAKYYLRFRINQNKRLKNPTKLAVVLDIDETSLSNYADLKHFRFGGSSEEINAAESDGHDPVIAATLSLFRYAKENGVAVFFVSGRKEYQRKNTMKNLRRAGYHDWDGLLLEPNNYGKDSAIPFKVANRKKITEMGYDIVLDIGDQFSDLKGGDTDMAIKLPNPYYYLP